jgi:microcin C transport system substrate-binding protein
VEDYWGKGLPVNTGQHNYNRIRYDYYRDTTVALQAFKAGEYDFRLENVSKNWATGYDTPAVEKGLIKLLEIPHSRPQGMQAFVFNTRKPVFKDSRVRQAITYAFDFEWSNKNLFYGQYTRTKSYFSNSELASSGLPGPEELKILAPFKGKIPQDVFTQEYSPPTTDGSGRIRKHLGKALALLRAAGWKPEKGKLVNSRSGTPLSFEILLSSPTWERISLPFKKNLERLGIDARIRTVDAAQYQKRVESFDFDMIVDVFAQSSSPGNEQRDFWGSAAADQNGSRNTIGIKDPVIDALVDKIITAADRKELIYATRALDRVLLWGHYVIPNWHIRHFRVAYWDKFGRPEITPEYNLPFNAWWIDSKKETELKQKKKSIRKR